MLEVSLSGVGTVLRLDRDWWSMVKLLLIRRATNVYAPLLPSRPCPYYRNFLLRHERRERLLWSTRGKNIYKQKPAKANNENIKIALNSENSESLLGRLMATPLPPPLVQLPRHGASCPVGIGVSCSADRQALGKITAEGVFLETLERDVGQFLPEVDETQISPEV